MKALLYDLTQKLVFTCYPGYLIGVLTIMPLASLLIALDGIFGDIAALEHDLKLSTFRRRRKRIYG